MQENCPIIPGTFKDENELVSEIEQINDQYHLLEILSAIRVALDHENGVKLDKNGYYVLILNYITRKLRIRYFSPSQIDEANTLYTPLTKALPSDNITLASSERRNESGV